MGLANEARTGDRRAALRELRDLLAEAIEECNSKRDLAALTTRFQSVLEELDQLGDSRAGIDPVDEILERRMKRRGVTRAS